MSAGTKVAADAPASSARTFSAEDLEYANQVAAIALLMIADQRETAALMQKLTAANTRQASALMLLNTEILSILKEIR